MNERSVRFLACFGAGLLLALCAALIAGTRIDPGARVLSQVGPVYRWAVDRDAHEICGLDEDLLIAWRLPVAWPLAVRLRKDGRAWVLHSVGGSASAPCRLIRADLGGVVEAETGLGPCSALALHDEGQAVVIERLSGSPAGERLVCVDYQGHQRILAETPGLACVACSGSSIFAGTGAGEVLEWPTLAPGAQPSRAQLEGPIVALAPGPSPGSAWVLLGEGGARLGLLDPGLVLRWSSATRGRSSHLGPVEGEERVWIGDRESSLLQRFGPGGHLELERWNLPVAGVEKVLAWRSTGVELVTPGAILRLDDRGRNLPGQGGFAYLVDLEPACRDGERGIASGSGELGRISRVLAIPPADGFLGRAQQSVEPGDESLGR